MSDAAGPSPDGAASGGERLRRGAAWLFIGQVVGLAAGLALSILVVRVLGPAGQGQYALAMVIIGLATLLLGQGVATGTMHYFASGKIPRGDIASTCVVVVVAGTLASWLILTIAVASGLSTSLLPGVGPGTILAAAIAIPLYLIRQFAAAALTGAGRFSDAAQLDPIHSIGTLGLVGGSFLVVPTVEAMLMAFIAACLISATLSISKVRSLGISLSLRPTWHAVRLISSFGSRTTVGSAFQYLTFRLDFALVNLFVSTSAVGVYSIASRFAELLWVLPGAVGNTIFTARSRRVDGDSAGQTGRAFWASAAITISAAVALGFVMPILVPLAYGPQMLGAILPLQILLPGAAFLGVSSILGNDLAARNRPGTVSVIAIATALATIALDLVLVPAFGVLGAAAASTVAYATYAVLVTVAYLRVSGTSPAEFARTARTTIDVLRAGR